MPSEELNVAKLTTFRSLQQDGDGHLWHRHVYDNADFQHDAEHYGTSPSKDEAGPMESKHTTSFERSGCWARSLGAFNKVSRLPCCPNRCRLARLVSLWFLILASWCLVFLLVGMDAAPPTGQLFLLGVLGIVAKCGGWLAVQARLPGLLGMLLAGILLQAVGLVTIDGPYLGLVKVIRKASLVIIMMRAGLDLDPEATRKLRFIILRLGVMPWAIESTCVAVLANLLFGLPWPWAFMLGVVEAAVSPAVVVPNLIILRQRGFGVVKGVPTLVLAVTGIEDAVAIAAFGVISSIMFSGGSLVVSIIQGPGSVLLGVFAGVLLGLVSRFIPDRQDPYAISLRTFVLLFGGLVAVLGTDRASLSGAGPLAVIVAAFVAGSGWAGQGWPVGQNQVALNFGVIWQFFEPAVFGLVGAQIKIQELPADTVGLAAACVLAPALVRFVCTLILLHGSVLNLKEKFFVALSWMAKATVQAVLGPAALDLVRDSTDTTARAHAQVMFVVCVISILLTAPVGAVIIATTGPRLLQQDPVMRAPPERLPSLPVIVQPDSGADQSERTEFHKP